MVKVVIFGLEEVVSFYFRLKLHFLASSEYVSNAHKTQVGTPSSQKRQSEAHEDAQSN